MKSIKNNITDIASPTDGAEPSTVKASEHSIQLHTVNFEVYKLIKISDLGMLKVFEDNETLYWLDVVGVHDTAIYSTICESLQINPASIEDLYNSHERSKVCSIDDNVFINLHIIPEQGTGKGEYEYVRFLIKDNLIISFRDSEKISFKGIYKNLEKPNSQARTPYSSFLLYLLLDAIVDHYFEMFNTIENEVDRFDQQISEESKEISIKEFYKKKRQIIHIRKSIRQLHDTTTILLQERFKVFRGKDHLYFHDLDVYVSRLIDEIELYHDLLGNLREMHLSNLNNAMNDTMRVLTIYASVFIPLTFVCSLYGMNFYNMPGLNSVYGYVIVWAVLIIMGIIGLIYFKRKKWL